MTKDDDLKIPMLIREKVISILKRHGARKISIFGSYIRGEATPDSDLDVLVEFPEAKGLIKFIGIENELSETLGIKVDLLTEKGISPYLVERIKKEAIVIYE